MMKAPKTLYMLVGLPCTGKSTWARENCTPDTMVLSTDQYVEAWASGEGISYQAAFEKYYKDAERALWANLARGIRYNMDIIWDQTNLTKAARAKKLRRFKGLSPGGAGSDEGTGYSKVAVYFPVPDNHNHLLAVRSSALRPKHIPGHVIETMRGALQEPQHHEGFDTIVICERGNDPDA